MGKSSRVLFMFIGLLSLVTSVAHAEKLKKPFKVDDMKSVKAYMEAKITTHERRSKSLELYSEPTCKVQGIVVDEETKMETFSLMACTLNYSDGRWNGEYRVLFAISPYQKLVTERIYDYYEGSF